MFAMRLRLLHGPFAGCKVDAGAGKVAAGTILWAYRNMYNAAMAVRAGDLPRTPSMEEYEVRDDDTAVHLGSGAAR
jgi:hypothetical protein